MLLVIALPVMACALASVGWIPVAAGPFARLRPGVPAILGTYSAWLILSALLTLDVSAVVAVPVGLAVAHRHGRGGRSQVAAAVVGANVGSLVFPFSNLTNLLLVAGTGMAFGTYVGLAWLPQIAAAIGAGAVLAVRARTLEREAIDAIDAEESLGELDLPDAQQSPASEPDESAAVTRLGLVGILTGVVAIGGALVTVIVGFANGDVAAVLTLVAAVITALALLDGRLDPSDIRHAVPISAVLVIIAAAALREPIGALATYLLVPDVSVPDVVALPAVALVGGVLAAILNNLPAAAFGAIWLSGASGPIVIAFLLGTNILALVTPHGSVATMLGRTLARRGGVIITPGDYLWRGWRYALAGTVPALMVLIALH